MENKKTTTTNNMYNQLLILCLLGKSCGSSSASFSFANLVPSNATNYTQHVVCK